MPTILIYDNFAHGNFSAPGGGPYNYVGGASPTVDVTQVPSGEPAAAKWTSTGYLAYQHSSPPTLGWFGMFYRMNTGEEPASNETLVQLFTTGFGQAAKLYYIPATNELSWTVADVAYQNSAITLDTYHWFEMIFDVSGATHTVYMNIDGSTKTSTADSGGGSASGIQFLEFGPHFVGGTHRFAHAVFGTASSTSDWLGQPAAGQVILPDADIATTGWSTAPLFSKINDSSDSTVITATAS